MNPKLFAVAQLILKELDQIDEIEEFDGINELYFIYKDTVFSIMKRSESTEFGEYSLYLYPKAKAIESVKHEFIHGDPENVFMLTLNASENNTCRNVLTKIYTEILEKHLGLDEIFENLLN